MVAFYLNNELRLTNITPMQLSISFCGLLARYVGGEPHLNFELGCKFVNFRELTILLHVLEFGHKTT
jgi:hypothetical protein